jgi:uncharacterized protein
MDRNRLTDETSPYLLQHKDNPVHWQPWSPDVLAHAKQADKPILLSVGYAACHWCHVMAHESFENPSIAALMNEHFVSIKVDREERPDLDAIYQHALALLGEQGGWPLTMFLTPDGEPFWGGTYFPPTSRWGRPGFPDVLRALSAAYRQEPDKVAGNVAALRDALRRLGTPQGGGGISMGITDQVAERLVREIDRVHGGIGHAPKFPQPGVFELLWRAWRRTGNEVFREAVTLTLDNMSQGGIYDHLGGGFARYSVDAEWLVPHFEKMLYDNAQLVELLALAWQETRKPLYAERIEETIGWVAREMMVDGAAFASSLDADSEHEEGKFYVWTESEIDRLLGGAGSDRAALFKRVYDVTPAGNWEGHTILNRLQQMERLDDPTEAELAACRRILFEAREPRVHPGRDDKVLADWNGLMIAALANASLAFGRRDWLDMAQRAFGFVSREMAEADGRLAHSWRAGRRRNPATVDDYADLSRAALALHEATGDGAYLARVERWLDILDRHYWDHTGGGGYFFTADDTEGLIARVKTAQDGPVPSGNGTMVGVLARLYHLTGDDRHRDRAETIVRTFSGELTRNFFPLGALLNGNELLQRAVQIVIRGARGEPGTEALLRAAYGASLPNRVLSVVADGETLPSSHPAAGKDRVGSQAAAYVCEGTTCSLPYTDPQLLTDDLHRRG